MNSSQKYSEISAQNFFDVKNQLLEIADLDELINKAYIEILGRKVDIGGYDYYMTSLKDGVLSRANFLDSIYQSEEYKGKKYNYQPSFRLSSYDNATKFIEENIENEVVRGSVDNISNNVVKKILKLVDEQNILINNYIIDVLDYEKYFNEAQYASKYPNYYKGNLKEKSLEHYIALKLLGLSKNDIFIDIASEHSPVPEIYSRLINCCTYSQDIMYPDGVHGDKIGGDACAMPLPDAFASKASLTCSIEHFEGDADTRLFKELSRILKVGGQIAVVPFYLFNEDATQTDPTISVPARVVFDEDCKVYCAEGWGNRHGRFYSPTSFMRRIVLPMKNHFHFDVYYFNNAASIDSSVYLRFAFVGTKL
ncbi:MAG: DUF4214 domain-containing protein [Candidatus Competibacteraceae bacterium]